MKTTSNTVKILKKGVTRVINVYFATILTTVLLTGCVGGSVLFKAIKHDEIDEVKRLIAEGANVNEITKNSQCTPLWIATMYEHPAEITKILLENGAKVDVGCVEWTPLQGASLAGRTEVVKLLLEKNPNIDAVNPYRNQTALDMARQKKHPEVVALLEKARKEKLGDKPEREYHSFSLIHSIDTMTINAVNEYNNNKPAATSSPSNTEEVNGNTKTTNGNNAFIKNEAKEANDEQNKSNDYYYNFYHKKAVKEYDEAEYYKKEEENYRHLAENGIKQGRDESGNLRAAADAQSKCKMHLENAKAAQEKADDYK